MSKEFKEKTSSTLRDHYTKKTVFPIYSNKPNGRNVKQLIPQYV